MPHKRARIFVFAERTERWVTDAGDVSRTAKLAALRNACTPQQASEAFYYGLLQLTRERTN